MKRVVLLLCLSSVMGCVARTGGASGPTAPPPAPPSGEGPPPAAPGAIDCAQQPNHSIDDNDRNLTFVGACDKIVVNGNNINISAERAAGIMVNGNNNNVSVGTADQIYTAGNNNNVTYQTGKPQIGNPGNGNNIGQR